MTLPILHTRSDWSPTESSFLLLITSTASFCEKNSSVSNRQQDYMDPLWMNVAVWKMQIWSPERKERLMWSHFLGRLTDFLSTNTLLNRRGQGGKVSTDSLDTQHGWVCSPAIPKARPGTAQCLLQWREHSWKAARTHLHQFCSLWSDQSLHTTKDTDPRNSPLPSHFRRVKVYASWMPLWWAGIQLLHHLKHYEMEKKYVCITGGEAIHSVDPSQYTLFVFGIRNFFLTLLYSTVWVCPQSLIAVLGGLIYYDNCSVLSLYFKFSKTECIFPSCGLKCCAVIQWKHN